MKLIAAFVAVSILGGGLGNEGNWSYNDFTTWPMPHCNGTKQSPINIVTQKATVNNTLAKFDPKAYFSTSPSSMTLHNKGKTVEISMADGPKINNSAFLPAVYQVDQFHFHWGLPCASRGSEHTVNSERYFGELHIVCGNTDYKPDERKKKKDGYAVLAFFLTADSTDTNIGIQNILDKKKSIEATETKANIPTFPLTDLINTTPKLYYRYGGSFTTPACYEVVVWTVFQTPIQITKKQMEEWQKSFYNTTSKTTFIGNNYRPTKELNGRKIYINAVGRPQPLTKLCCLIALLTSLLH